jgi:hypothetical protein
MKKKKTRQEILATKLPEELDRRRKILTSEHPYIKEKHRNGESIRKLAKDYNVDRRLIQFIIYPERLELNKRYYKERGQSKKSYARVKGAQWAKTMRDHRHYKLKVLNK